MSTITKELNNDTLPVKPTILFDIDGVFNAWLKDKADYWYGFPELTPDDAPFAIDKQQKCIFSNASVYSGFPDSVIIQWSSELAKTVRDFHDNNNVQFVWLTSWDDNANELATQCLWPNQKPIMEGFLPTWIRRHTDDSKRGQVCDLRNVWIEKFTAGEIPYIPPIVHFDDFPVGDFRQPDDNWHGMFGEYTTDIKMEISPYLFINTNARCGITRKEWQEAVSFIEQHTPQKELLPQLQPTVDETEPEDITNPKYYHIGPIH